MNNIKRSSLFGKEFIKKHFYKFLIFSFVGATSALIHMLFFNIFRFWVGINFNVSVVFATIVAIIYNFSMNRNITFSARKQALKPQIIRYLIVYLISISINFTVAFSVQYILGEGILNENIAAFSGIIVSIPFSFLGSLLWAFKKKEEIIVS